DTESCFGQGQLERGLLDVWEKVVRFYVSQFWMLPAAQAFHAYTILALQIHDRLICELDALLRAQGSFQILHQAKSFALALIDALVEGGVLPPVFQRESAREGGGPDEFIDGGRMIGKVAQARSGFELVG